MPAAEKFWDDSKECRGCPSATFIQMGGAAMPPENALTLRGKGPGNECSIPLDQTIFKNQNKLVE